MRSFDDVVADVFQRAESPFHDQYCYAAKQPPPYATPHSLTPALPAPELSSGLSYTPLSPPPEDPTTQKIAAGDNPATVGAETLSARQEPVAEDQWDMLLDSPPRPRHGPDSG